VRKGGSERGRENSEGKEGEGEGKARS